MTDLTHPSFPLSSSYDADWLLSLDMGPNPLWLLEDLLRDMSILPGSRVLDLGSGRGATSVFLAKELGVEVWAADLWISPAVVEPMLRDLGLSGQVHPVQEIGRATSELQSLMRISYAVFCLKTKHNTEKVQS